MNLHCLDICRERQGVVHGHAKDFCTLGGGHHGVDNRDGEFLKRAGLPREEEQLRLEVEVVGRHPNQVLNLIIVQC